eukprot:504701_1
MDVYFLVYIQFFLFYTISPVIFWKVISKDYYIFHWQIIAIKFRYRHSAKGDDIIKHIKVDRNISSYKYNTSSYEQNTSSYANYTNPSSYVSRPPHYPGFNSTHSGTRAREPLWQPYMNHSPFVSDSLNNCCSKYCDKYDFNCCDISKLKDEFEENSSMFFILLLSKMNAISQRNLKIIKYSVAFLEVFVMVFMIVILTQIFIKKPKYEFDVSKVPINPSCKYTADILYTVSKWISFKIL